MRPFSLILSQLTVGLVRWSHTEAGFLLSTLVWIAKYQCLNFLQCLIDTATSCYIGRSEYRIRWNFHQFRLWASLVKILSVNIFAQHRPLCLNRSTHYLLEGSLHTWRNFCHNTKYEPLAKFLASKNFCVDGSKYVMYTYMQKVALGMPKLVLGGGILTF